MSKRVSPLVALVVVPTVAAARRRVRAETGKFIVRGIRDVAPVAGMFVFAILYFGIVTDAGLLDPVIDRILRVVGARPAAGRGGHGTPRAGRPPGRVGCRHVPRDHPGHAAAVRAAGDGSARARLRGLAGRGGELPAVDGARRSGPRPRSASRRRSCSARSSRSRPWGCSTSSRSRTGWAGGRRSGSDWRTIGRPNGSSSAPCPRRNSSCGALASSGPTWC